MYMFVGVYVMCQEWTLCMYSPYQEQTSNQERTHSMSAVGFGISLGLVIIENSGIRSVGWVWQHGNIFFRRILAYHER